MDIFKLLDEVDELVHSSSKVPLSGKAMIDRGELLDLIDEIRIKLPDELKQAEWIKEERQRILSEAQTEADTMLKEVQVHIEGMIDQHEIVTEAEKRGTEILSRAQMSAKEVRIGAREYADNILSSVVQNLKHIGSKVNETIEQLEGNREELNDED